MANILSEVKVRVNKESTFQPVVNTQLETDINLAGAVNKIAEWYDEIADLKTMKGAYVYKGSIDNIDALPLTNNKTGDIYNVLYEYILQEAEPEDWETNYSNYYTKDGSEYSNVEGVEAPTWTTDTYYTRTDNGMNYGWTSALSSGTLSDWDALGGNIDLEEATYHDIERFFSNPYLEIGCTAPFTLETTAVGWDGTIEYSTDTVEWTEWDGTAITSNEANILYLRGTNNTVITGNNSDPFTFTTEGKIFIYGKLDVVFDYMKAMRNIDIAMGEYACYNMFNGAPLMTAPELPMTVMSAHCYESMFEGCTDLAVTPELVATTLADACYKNMFKGCTNLRVLPKLHAKTMYPSCYEGMFNGCTIVELSETATDVCWMNYRVPAANTGVDATDALKDMFANTSGTFTGTPVINTTYYTSNTDVAKNQLTVFSGSYDDLTDKPELFSGNYNDLSNKPALKAVAISGSYNDLTNKPTLSDVATSGSYNDLNDTPELSAVATSGSYDDLTNKPTLFSGSYNDLTDKPNFSTVATSGSYSDLSGTPSLSPVATSGNYNDLTNKPGDPVPYLTFTGTESFTLKTSNGKMWNGTIEYSTNKTTWATWDGSSSTAISSGAGNVLYLRGKNNTHISATSSSVYSSFVFATTGTIACNGDIRTLLNYENPENTTMDEYCYFRMFYNCTSLTVAPALSATTLASYCYYEMFRGCTSLIVAPELPATTLTRYCYRYMFQNCVSLTTMPILPARTLAEYCYVGMFDGCASLTTIPRLPATTLANYCYASMFKGCTSLTTIPALPVTTLADHCYENMFDGCISLTTIPRLPAITLKTNCYAHMFNNCTSLVTTPRLPATTLASYCYYEMFRGCTSLITMPILPAITLVEGCYSGMFYDCTNIKLSATQTGAYQTPYRIPTTGTGTTGTNSLGDMFYSTGGTFTGTPTINTTYYTCNFVMS